MRESTSKTENTEAQTRGHDPWDKWCTRGIHIVGDVLLDRTFLGDEMFFICAELHGSYLLHMVMSTWNMPSTTEELNFKSYLILTNIDNHLASGYCVGQGRFTDHEIWRIAWDYWLWGSQDDGNLKVTVSSICESTLQQETGLQRLLKLLCLVRGPQEMSMF